MQAGRLIRTWNVRSSRGLFDSFLGVTVKHVKSCTLLGQIETQVWLFSESGKGCRFLLTEQVDGWSRCVLPRLENGEMAAQVSRARRLTSPLATGMRLYPLHEGGALRVDVVCGLKEEGSIV